MDSYCPDSTSSTRSIRYDSNLEWISFLFASFLYRFVFCSICSTPFTFYFAASFGTRNKIVRLPLPSHRHFHHKIKKQNETKYSPINFYNIFVEIRLVMCWMLGVLGPCLRFIYIFHLAGCSLLYFSIYLILNAWWDRRTQSEQNERTQKKRRNPKFNVTHIRANSKPNLKFLFATLYFRLRQAEYEIVLRMFVRHRTPPTRCSRSAGTFILLAATAAGAHTAFDLNAVEMRSKRKAINTMRWCVCVCLWRFKDIRQRNERKKNRREHEERGKTRHFIMYYSHSNEEQWRECGLRNPCVCVRLYTRI